LQAPSAKAVDSLASSGVTAEALPPRADAVLPLELADLRGGFVTAADLSLLVGGSGLGRNDAAVSMLA
jgi:hypothetical protein